ncbi:helix-turn-helix domain-containing protein [Haloferacaceae archaeon DSL9]
MSVIAEFRISPTDFELGRILSVEGASSIELETLVPSGEATVPLFWIFNSERDSFLETLQRHPTVNNAADVDVFEDRTLFKLDWDAHHDHVFQGIIENEGQILSATGIPGIWKFELRFPSHDELGEFKTHCEDAQIALDVVRVFNPTKPEAGPWYGLTEPQREAITLAVRMGYYDIPRGCTTKQLADELGISDQAVTERLRRAVAAFVRHTLLTNASEA